jgi:hypothetical protein
MKQSGPVPSGRAIDLDSSSQTSGVTTSQNNDAQPENGAKGSDVKESQDWEVIDPAKETDGEHRRRGRGLTASYSFDVGWGRWKTTLFSWELNLGSRAERKWAMEAKKGNEEK